MVRTATWPLWLIEQQNMATGGSTTITQQQWTPTTIFFLLFYRDTSQTALSLKEMGLFFSRLEVREKPVRSGLYKEWWWSGQKSSTHLHSSLNTDSMEKATQLSMPTPTIVLISYYLVLNFFTFQGHEYEKFEIPKQWASPSRLGFLHWK